MAGRFRFNGHAQLQNIENAIQANRDRRGRSHKVPAGIAIDERPAPCRVMTSHGHGARNRLAHNGPAHAHAPHHFLLRGKFCAAVISRKRSVRPPVDNLRAEAFGLPSGRCRLLRWRRAASIEGGAWTSLVWFISYKLLIMLPADQQWRYRHFRDLRIVPAARRCNARLCFRYGESSAKTVRK